MRCLLFLLLAGILHVPLFSQKTRTKTVSFYFSTLNGLSFSQPGIEGDWTRRQQKQSFIKGLEYRTGINKWLSLSTGLEYAKHTITITPQLSTPPFTVYDSYPRHYELLSVPINIQADFLKYLFVNLGTMVDVQLLNTALPEDMSGIGLTFGAGARYFTKSQLGFFIYPYMQQHALIVFESSNRRRRLYTSGIRAGVSYRF